MRRGIVRLVTSPRVCLIGVHRRLSAADGSRFSAALAVLVICGIVVAPSGALAADARNYPDRPIRFDPYAPGGGSGVVARLVAVKLGEPAAL